MNGNDENLQIFVTTNTKLRMLCDNETINKRALRTSFQYVYTGDSNGTLHYVLLIFRNIKTCEKNLINPLETTQIR
jgi:hypothetical protein